MAWGRFAPSEYALVYCCNINNHTLYTLNVDHHGHYTWVYEYEVWVGTGPLQLLTYYLLLRACLRERIPAVPVDNLL